MAGTHGYLLYFIFSVVWTTRTNKFLFRLKTDLIIKKKGLMIMIWINDCFLFIKPNFWMA